MARLLFVLLAVTLGVAYATMAGGLTEARPATADDQKIADQVKDAASAEAGANFAEFTVVSVKTQVVAGINYYMKVSVGGGQYVHIRVFKSLPHEGSTVHLTAVQTGKQLEDPIGFF